MLIPDSIMTICAGNLCRSPFAAIYLQRRLQDAGLYLDVYSRGLLAMPGRHCPETAQKAAAEFSVDMSRHISQPLLAFDVDRAGLVLVMTSEQNKHITKTRPSSGGKVFLMSHASYPEASRPVEDPMGKDLDTYRKVYAEIIQYADAWLKQFGINT